MKVTALIADDEAIARAGLRRLLAGVDWLRVVGEATHGPETVRMIDELKPDVVLLDVRMPGLLGTDALRMISHRPQVVFTTAHAEHAATAFELGALDYLLKPFGAERLAAALDRVRAALGEPGPSPVERLGDVFGANPIRRLFVRSGRAIIPVAVSDVRRFEADGDYVTAHTGASGHVLHVAIARLARRLDPAVFVRIHRAHIVNLQYVASFTRSARGQLEARLTDGTALPVSRSRAQEVRALGV